MTPAEYEQQMNEALKGYPAKFTSLEAANAEVGELRRTIAKERNQHERNLARKDETIHSISVENLDLASRNNKSFYEGRNVAFRFVIDNIDRSSDELAIMLRMAGLDSDFRKVFIETLHEWLANEPPF